MLFAFLCGLSALYDFSVVVFFLPTYQCLMIKKDVNFTCYNMGPLTLEKNSLFKASTICKYKYSNFLYFSSILFFIYMT